MDSTNIELLEEIDSGLYGRVFKARQIELDRYVAVKIIKPEWHNVTDAVAHARALARVGPHPNIVTVYGVSNISIDGMGVDLPAVIMEWLEGETLAARIGGNKFQEQEARKICIGVLDGIEHMHASDVAHGDFHAGNVILTMECTPKIIDIDPTKENSLARLSTLSREGAVNGDISFCRRIVILVLQHARFRNTQINSIDAELQSADTLADVRQTVKSFFDSVAEQSPSEAVRLPERDWIDCAYCEGKGSVVGYRDAFNERLDTCGICAGRGRIFTDLWNQPYCRRCTGSGALISKTRQYRFVNTNVQPCDVCAGTGREPKLVNTG